MAHKAHRMRGGIMAASTIINWAQNRFLHHWHHFLQERKARSWEVEQPDKNSFNQNRASEFNPRPIYPQIGIKVKRSATFKLISYCCQISGLKLTEMRCFMTNVEAASNILTLSSISPTWPMFEASIYWSNVGKIEVGVFQQEVFGHCFQFFSIKE